MMDCNRYKDNLETFADGELHGDVHQGAIDHFHACEDCQNRILQIHQMKASLDRAWSTTQAPHNLREQIIVTLDPNPVQCTNQYAGNGTTKPLHPVPATSKRSRLRRWFIPAAIAAAIVIVVMIIPDQYGNSENPTLTLVPPQALEAVVDQHRICSAHGGVLHHDNSLTRDLDTISQKLSQQLGLTVFAPDLTTQGYEMVGANHCGIKNLPGAHILYRAGTSTMLSAFTVHHLDGLANDKPVSGGNHHYFVSDVQNISVVAWHENKDSYVLCGKISQPKMIELIEGVRTASAIRREFNLAFLANIHD